MTTGHTSLPRILLVDDDVDIGLALQDFLEHEGYQVDSVQTGREALRRVTPTHSYSSVILDLGLPDIDGLTVLQRLHDQEENLPVIILTAHGDQNEKIAALQYHPFAHLIKPYDRRELLAIVHRAVGFKQLTLKVAEAEQALVSSETSRQEEQRRTETLLSESERRLRLALKAGHMGIWDWDVQNDQLAWSEEVATLFGIDQDSLPKTLEEFLSHIHPDDRARCQAAMRAAREDGAPYGIDHRLIRPSGEVRWINSQGQVVNDEAGGHPRLLGTIQDITMKKDADLRLRESETRFRQLVEAMKEVFWMSSPDKSEILYVSPGYEHIWGRSCFSLYASPQSWIDAIHPDDRARIRERALTKQTLGTYEEEYRIVTPEGTTRWIRDRAFPVKDSTGAVYRIVGVAEDISGQKRIQHGLDALARASWELSGQALFQALVWEMGAILKVPFAFIAEHMNGDQPRARTRVFLARGAFADPVDYALAGTPCEEAWNGKRCFWPDHLRQQFPNDQWLAKLGIESYLAHPLLGLNGQVIGHVGVMDVEPMVRDPFWSGILEFVALRAATELSRMSR